MQVRVEHLHKSFRGGREPVLRGVDMEFQEGKLTYILGSSGAGKSVLLKHVLGLVRPDRGKIWVGGKNMAELSGKELYAHRKHFGMLFQGAALFDDMTVFDNVAFPLREHEREMSEEQVQAAVEKALTAVSMPTGHAKLPSELSGGMRKRVGLARAIVRQPSILLYDEPTTGLDPVTRIMVDELIESLKSQFQMTSIVISHDIPAALLLADQIAFLHEGRIVFVGTPQEFTSTRIEAVKSFLDAERRSMRALQAAL